VSSGKGRTMVLELQEDLLHLVDPMLLIQRVADQVVDFVDGARGTLVGMIDDSGDVLYVCGSGLYGPWVGMQIGSMGSLSGQCVRENRVLVAEDTASDSRVDAEACLRVNARSIVCVPIRRGRECVGVVNVGSTSPNAFSDGDVQLLSEITEFVSTVVVASAELSGSARRLFAAVSDGMVRPSTAPESTDPTRRVASFVGNVLSPAAQRHRQERSLVKSIVERRAIELYYQPIVDLRDRRVFGVEVLSRIWEEPYHSPDYWFAMAESAGLGLEMEMLAIEQALASIDELAPGLRMTVNASPSTMLSSWLYEAVSGAADPQRIVVELTEHVGVVDYEALLEARGALRRCGASVAVDDAGTGISGLSHILRLQPELIKLDRELITGVDSDRARHALVESLVAFAGETGAMVIAEGIETGGELEMLAGLGVTMGQGYYLGMPAPLRELPADLRA